MIIETKSSYLNILKILQAAPCYGNNIHRALLSLNLIFN